MSPMYFENCTEGNFLLEEKKFLKMERPSVKGSDEKDGKIEDKAWQPMKENREWNMDRWQKIELGHHCLIWPTSVK